MEYYTVTKRTTAICSNIDQSLTHTQWKKPDTKEYISYDAIYMKFKNRQNQSEMC